MPKSSNSSGVIGTARPSEGPAVLIAAPMTSESTEALRRAAAVSQALTGELVSLRVSAPPAGPTDERFDDIGEDAHRRAFDQRLSPHRRGRNVLTRRGDFLSVVAETARALRPAVVVIPDVCGLTGRCVHDLAVECGAPILLAREAISSRVIIAASNLRNPDFPVLRAGALISESLDARVVFLHNFTPGALFASGATETWRGWPPSVLDRLDDLEFAAHLLQVESRNVVTIRPSVAEALLSVVQSERPDLVIVGTRGRSPSSAVDSPLAAKMMDELPHSVLVVPPNGLNPFDLFDRERC